jgi:RNA polymerase sigma-70 factor (ECF subfamily)
MAGGDGERKNTTRRVVYCVVPRQLGPKLHDLLRRHFGADRSIEVIVEGRASERRRGSRRLADLQTHGEERRRIRSAEGRRAGERRAPAVAVDPLPLPRQARRYQDQLTFLECFEPPSQHAEDIDTARLVARIQGGDKDAFALLYVRYFDRVYGYLRLMLRDTHEAEDVTQRVFIRVLEALPAYQHRQQPFRGWLFVIARNLGLNYLQKHKHVDLVDPNDISTRQEALGGQESDLPALSWLSDTELLLFIERLPLAQRQVLVLRYMVDLSHAEVAATLDRTVEDVRGLQHRALRFLRERLTAIGRAPAADRSRRTRILRCPKQAPVLRARRFSLT